MLAVIVLASSVRHYTAAVVALCFSLAVVPAFAEETQETAFVLLPDKSLDRDWVGLGRDTLFLMGYQVFGIGVLYALPESVSSWSDEQKKNLSLETWWNHVRHPQWDKDDWTVNYIGHTYFGATYYTRARERGFGEIDSFLYAALGSAIYEFGVEALFERPSYQDLIVTPVGGALLGFALEPVRNWIKRKPELQWYDHLVLIATDPIGALNSVGERLLGIKSDIRVDVGRNGTIHAELRMLWK
jgi:Domain of unknown function (DUF3943)